MTAREHESVVVWGNCQAEPLADLLREPLARHGLDVARVPAVFLVDEAELAEVHALVARAAVLVTQPVRDNYRIPGCGMHQLAALLPPSGRVVTYPVTFHVGAFPYQVNAHGGDGERVDAAVSVYHDLRAIVAAERHLDVDETLAWWPAPEETATRQVADTSLAELRRREADLDVTVSDAVDDPDALWTMDHPANAVLAHVARGVLAALGIDDTLATPDREFLAARRTPVERAVIEAHGWAAASARPDWVVDKVAVPWRDVIAAHLAQYADRPDIVADTRVRQAARLETLGL